MSPTLYLKTEYFHCNPARFELEDHRLSSDTLCDKCYDKALAERHKLCKKLGLDLAYIGKIDTNEEVLNALKSSSSRGSSKRRSRSKSSKTDSDAESGQSDKENADESDMEVVESTKKKEPIASSVVIDISDRLKDTSDTQKSQSTGKRSGSSSRDKKRLATTERVKDANEMEALKHFNIFNQNDISKLTTDKLAGIIDPLNEKISKEPMQSTRNQRLDRISKLRPLTALSMSIDSVRTFHEESQKVITDSLVNSENAIGMFVCLFHFVVFNQFD